MTWRLRHQGSPQSVRNLTFEQIVQGLRDGVLDPTDEVQAEGDAIWQAIENHPQLAEIAEEVEPRIGAKRTDEATSIDMNALIDVCMVLLIFFILTTSYVTAVQKVVPLSGTREGKGIRVVKAAEVKNKMVRLQASHDPGGKLSIRVENQTVDAVGADGSVDSEKLASSLQPFLSGGERKTEMLLDARDVTWGTVIAIQDGARAAGIQKVHHLLRK
ncbi:MAG: biopolymer transporter ExbD [Gemmataceae bacterium]|nr:biopolymer transporter ExbD [Gemmataceae bacterium]